MQGARYRAVAAVRSEPWRSPPPEAARTIRSRLYAASAAVAGLIRTWREREQLRRELASMSQRDFGDVAVPVGAVRDEARRWPWQKVSLGNDAPERRQIATNLPLRANEAALEGLEGGQS